MKQYARNGLYVSTLQVYIYEKLDNTCYLFDLVHCNLFYLFFAWTIVGNGHYPVISILVGLRAR